ncbi:hypothetical protein [Flexivirga sp. B27]
MNELLAGYASYASTDAILQEHSVRAAAVNEPDSSVSASLTVTVSWSWTWSW